MFNSNLLDGKKLSNEILDNIKKEVSENTKCKLVVVTIGEDSASKVYVNNKRKACEKIGFQFEHKKFSSDDSYDYIQNYFYDKEFNDENVYGIILQLPVVSNVLTDIEIAKISMISSDLDVDGFTAYSEFIPCTPKGIVRILDSIKYEYQGKTALVIGRSDIVGKPIAELLLDRNCTVIQAHSKTPKEILLKMFSCADLVVSAVGKPNLITEEEAYQYFKDNRHDFYGDFSNKKTRVIIDVGINKVNDKICGDLPETFKQKYSHYYTPVPGGVGPMTVAMLLENVWESYKEKHPVGWEETKRGS